MKIGKLFNFWTYWKGWQKGALIGGIFGLFFLWLTYFNATTNISAIFYILMLSIIVPVGLVWILFNIFIGTFIGAIIGFILDKFFRKYFWILYLLFISLVVILSILFLPTLWGKEFSSIAPGDLSITYITAPPTAYSGSPIQITAYVQNNGDQIITRNIEGCIFPTTWKGIAYPTYSAYTSIPTPSCCPQNEFCDAKTITINPGQPEIVILNPKAPSPTSVDYPGCGNNLGTAWHTSFDVVVGIYSICKSGYISYKTNPILVSEGTTTTTTPQDTCNQNCKIYGYTSGICSQFPVGNYHLLGNFCPSGLECWCSSGITTTTSTTIPSCIPGQIQACLTIDNKLGEKICDQFGRWGNCIVKEDNSRLFYIIGAIVLILIVIIIIQSKKVK